MFNCSESNEVLKFKFKKLHSKVVDSVNPVNVINILFQEDVIGASDMKALLKLRDDPQQQCSEMLAHLHTSGNREAFVQLYLAIKKESHLQWLVEEIDEYNVHLPTSQQPYVKEQTGKQMLQHRRRRRGAGRARPPPLNSGIFRAIIM